MLILIVGILFKLHIFIVLNFVQNTEILRRRNKPKIVDYSQNLLQLSTEIGRQSQHHIEIMSGMQVY